MTKTRCKFRSNLFGLSRCICIATVMLTAGCGGSPDEAPDSAPDDTAAVTSPAEDQAAVAASKVKDVSPADETVAASLPTEDQPVVKPSAVAEDGSEKLLLMLTVFTLAVFVGVEIITKIPPTLHTPLMSGSNAISGVTLIGALLATGSGQGAFASFLGFFVVVFATVNCVGGFLVTHRMLDMFRKKK